MKIQSILGSLALHSTLLAAGGALMMTPPQYGVEVGAGGVDIDLVAAPLPEDTRSDQETAFEEPVNPEEFSEPVPVVEEVVPVVEQVLSKPSSAVGDGSSAVPGEDATTLRASSGALTEAKPKYLRNPAPYYPESSRKRGEEGLVVLVADIDAVGKVKELTVKSSSGYTALDASALKAVHKWKFEPARLGSMALESKVEVPVRFQLNEK